MSKTKAEVWNFCGSVGNLLAVTGTVVGVLLSGFYCVLFSGVPYMPLLDYVVETVGVSLLHVELFC